MFLGVVTCIVVWQSLPQFQGQWLWNAYLPVLFFESSEPFRLNMDSVSRHQKLGAWGIQDSTGLDARHTGVILLLLLCTLLLGIPCSSSFLLQLLLACYLDKVRVLFDEFVTMILYVSTMIVSYQSNRAKIPCTSYTYMKLYQYIWSMTSESYHVNTTIYDVLGLPVHGWGPEHMGECCVDSRLINLDSYRKYVSLLGGEIILDNF